MSRPALLSVVASLALALSGGATAETVVANRTLRAAQVVQAGDLRVTAQDAPSGYARSPEEVIGREARVTLYAGRPIAFASLADPAVVERNALITLIYQSGAVVIRAEGRALGRGAEGDEIRVMNLGSRTTLTGIVMAPNLVRLH